MKFSWDVFFAVVVMLGSISFIIWHLFDRNKQTKNYIKKFDENYAKARQSFDVEELSKLWDEIKENSNKQKCFENHIGTIALLYFINGKLQVLSKEKNV